MTQPEANAATTVAERTIFPENTVLLLVDVQQGMDDPKWGQRNNPDAEANIARLLQAWRDSSRPVIHVQHHSTTPGSPLAPHLPGVAFKPEAMPLPDEPIVPKRVNSAFIGTDLEAYLRQRGLNRLMIVGLTTNHCVSTTTRMAANLGFETYLVADATAAFEATDHQGRRFDAEQIHAVALANLHGEFATVVDTAAVLARLSRSLL